MFTNTASAQAGNNNGNALMNDATAPTLRAKSYTYFKVAEKCIKSHMRNTIKTTPGAAGTAGQTTPSQYGGGGSDGTDRGEWFADDDAFGQVYPEGSTKCDRIIQEGMKMWGFESGSTFLRAIGFTFDPNVPQWKSPDNDGDKRFDFFKKAVYGRVGDIEQLAQGAPMHLLYLKAFSEGEPYCNAKKVIKYDDADATLKQWADNNTRRNSEIYTTVTLVEGPEGKDTFRYIFTYAGGSNGDTKTGILWQYRGNGISGPGDSQFRESYNCSEIASRISTSAIALRDWNTDHPEKKEDSSTTPPGSNDPTPTDIAPTCTIDGVGWILCPVFTFLGGITDAAYNFVGSLLTVQPLTVIQSDTGLFAAWSVMRNIANIAFVIAFLIIIFSQLTSVGVSNYGVKKMLPRLVIAAILVNISYWVCAIAIDLSNIAGTSVKGMFEAIGVSIPSTVTPGIDNNLATGGGWTGIVGGVIAGTLVGGTIFYVGLSALIPGLLAAVAAIITVFLVLTLRQALIILLVVIAPLAFVAYLLPNTEDLFHKWRKLLTTLLLMFPIIAGIFGASALASGIVMNASDNIVVQIMGATIAIIPLALTPIVMKAAGGVLNRFGGIVNNTEKGPIDRLRKRGEAFRDRRQGYRAANALTGKRVFGGGQFRRKARRELNNQAAKDAAIAGQAAFSVTDPTASAYAQSSASSQLATSAINTARNNAMTNGLAVNGNQNVLNAMGSEAAANEEIAKALAAQTAKAVAAAIEDVKLSANIPPGDLAAMSRQFADAVKSGDSITARAMQDMMLSSGGAGVKKWRESVAGIEQSSGTSIGGQIGEDLRKHILDKHPGIKGTDASIMGWATDGGRQRLSTIQADVNTWSLTNEEFAGQKAFAQHDALDSGAISKERAKEIIDNDELMSKIDEGVKVKLRSLNTP